MSADLAAYTADPAGLESLDRQSVVAIMERAKTWLDMAVERDTEIGDLVEFKGQAETVRVYTVQKQLGKDAELAAQELVRRAERGIGKAIRKGQERGEIRKIGDDTRVDLADRVGVSNLVSPQEAAQVNHRSDLAPIYHMTDGVTDEQFDAAITEAKAEGNLTRRNVVRKVTGRSASKSTRPEVRRGTHHIQSRRVMAATVESAANVVIPSVLAEINLSELEAHDLQEWISSLSESIKALGSLRTTLKKELNQRG